ncbi:MAG: CoA ester lyase [Proteobacteria bacterium]|nr:CoA ester lyase [Pseudomonadota bacterium]
MKILAAHARSFLFLPADRLERLGKALASGAHMVIVDLEDAVAPDAKSAARTALQAQWALLDPVSRTRIAIRVNAPSTPWHENDCGLIEALAGDGLGGVVIAKTESVAPLSKLAQRVSGVPLLPLIESAEGLATLDLITRAPGVVRLLFGHLDFQVDLGLQCDVEERELDAVRLAFVVASRRAGLPCPVDGVTVDLQRSERLEADTQRSKRFGFTGKLCIHPCQVAAVNTSLGPTAAQLEWAQRVLAAAHEHQAGAFQFEGAMVDAPVLARARALLQLSL